MGVKHKYFFVSDIHGCYDDLITALKKSNFNKETDTLVSLGDPFDRGPKSLEVLDFLLSCPNHIFIWGNHDRRLRTLLLGQDFFNYCDDHNGVPATLDSFLGQHYAIDIALHAFNYFPEYNKVKNKLWSYFQECYFAVEWKDLIATHGWLPIIEVEKDKYILNKDWRKSNKDDWDAATWCHSIRNYSNKLFPEKRLLVGHWGSYQFHRLINFEVEDNFNTYEDEHITVIDGTTNASHQVNVYIYETDEKPILYEGLK